jgi:agmatinase
MGIISLPLIRAAARGVHSDLTVLHIGKATPMHILSIPNTPRRCDPVQTAMPHWNSGRGQLLSCGITRNHDAFGVYDYTRSAGYNIITMRDFQNADMTMSWRIWVTLAGRAVYLSWDMNVFDPSCGGLHAGRVGSARVKDRVLRDLHTVCVSSQPTMLL